MKKKETAVGKAVSEVALPEEADRKKPKRVFLKQYLVSGSKDVRDPGADRKAAFIMHTCAKSARDEFKERFGMDVESCAQVAESAMTKDDMDGRDFWKEGLNRETERRKPEQTESAKRYFRLKDRAEFVQAEKKRLGIKDWDSATEEQIGAVGRSLSEWEKGRPV